VLPPTVDPAASIPTEAEASLLSAGTNALRKAHDPARAAVIFDDYLSRYPRGALVEEALVLAIEAAVALDDGSAGGLADRYLRQFPRGRFHDYAASVVDSERGR
jgi:outer membrane protein assembly factor BamD (BamD/ComL family)